MSTVTFDKLAFVDTLTRGGIPEDQARAQADALDAALRDTVATRADVVALKADIAAIETRMVKWLVPLLLGQTALIVALVKLL